MTTPTPPTALTDAEIAELRAMFNSQRRGILVMPDEAERVVRLCDALLDSYADRRHLAGLLSRGVQFVEQDGAELDRLRERLKLAEQDRNDAQERLHREAERFKAALDAALAASKAAEERHSESLQAAHRTAATASRNFASAVQEAEERGRVAATADICALLRKQQDEARRLDMSGGYTIECALKAIAAGKHIGASGAGEVGGG